MGTAFQHRSFPWILGVKLSVMVPVFVLVLIAGVTFVNASNTKSESQKIEAMLDAVKSSEVTFLRNGNEYTSLEAYDHLRKKLEYGAQFLVRTAEGRVDRTTIHPENRFPFHDFRQALSGSL